MASTLPDSMQAQQFDAYKKPYKIQSVPTLMRRSCGDAGVGREAASYCHTDYVLACGQMPGPARSFPHIGCHEFTGTVVSQHSSPSQNARAFSVGARIGVPGRSFHACGFCFECRNEWCGNDPFAHDSAGYSVNCAHAKNNGLSRDGGFAEYAVVDARQVAPIPDVLATIKTTPLMCAGVTIYAALKRCRLEKGDKVGIPGAVGGPGHLGLQYGVKMGYKVLGVEAVDAPLALAEDVAGKLHPQTRIVDARTEKASDVVKQLGSGDGKKTIGKMGVDAVIILPESQAASDYGMALL